MKTNSFNSLMMVISLIIYWIVPSKSWAQVQVDGICYNLYPWDNLAGVTSNPNNYSGSIVIPNSIVYSGNTYSVFSIDSEAFSNCTELTSVNIPSSVTSIGESAFYGCKGLTSISIPSSVTSIGNSAFYECTGLTSMAIPNSVTSIGGYAFYGCTDLTSIEIPSSVTVIGGYAFHNTAWYDDQPEGLIYINNVAYEYKWEAYEDASFNIALRNGTVSISGGAFSNYMVGLKSIVIPNTVTSIGDYAFAGCTGLTSLFIPNSVTNIGHEAFSYCTGLTSINVCWETLWDIDIDYGAFGFDKTACTLYVPIGSKSEYEAYGWEDFKNIVERSPVRDTGSCGDNVSYTIYPDYHMVISGMGQMWMDGWDEWLPNAYCNVLQEVIIEDGVTSIGLCAFSDCTGLTSVTIPNSVTSIGGSAFSDCTGLTSVTIPNSVTSIGSSAFYGCTGLTSVTIPSSVTSIDYDAFYLTPWYHRQPNGLVYINNVVYKYKGKIPEGTAIALRAGTVSISGTAFSGCTGLTSIEIPNSVTSIGYRAFYNCTGLTSIKVGWEAPLALSYSSDVFDNIDRTVCTLYVPAGSKTSYERAYIWNTFSNIVEYIPTLATGSCGDNVTYTIYSDMSMVISGTGAMTDFTINYDDDTINRENNEYWTQAKTVTIEEGVTSIGNYAFSNCTELISVSIPNSVTSIGSSAFLGCEALTSITIPASVETIGADALTYTGLTHIYIEDCDDVLQFEQVAFDMDDYEDPLEYVYLGRNISTIDFHEYNPWEGVAGYPPFSRSSNLHTLEIGDKVTYIENWSFNSAPLQSLVIGSNVQSIGTRALSSANVGQTLVIPSNVKRMGDYSLSPSISTLVLEKGSDDLELFAGYNSLELSFFGSESSIDSIYVGRNLTCSSNNIHVVCRSACFDASLRRTMNTSGEEEEFDLTEYYIPPVCATKYYFRSGASVGEYYFQNSPVEHVYNLRSSRVGNYAFFDSNVKTVSFDAEGSTTIGNGVFSGCEGLTTLSFPEGMTDIGYGAFMDCYGLTSITIPSSLKSIGGDCFFMDDTEKNVSFNVYISDLSAWCSMDIGWGGSPLIWGHLIYNGEEISNLVVPDDVQSIGMGAFDGCSSLTSVVIPESVTSIGDRAFSYTGLISVTVERSVPLTIEGSTFEGIDKTNCILYVPAGSKTAYEDAEYWSEFENIEEYTPAPEVLATGSCGDNVTYTIYSSMTMVISGTGAMDDADGQIYGWETINNVIIEDGVTTIGDCVFEGCTSLTSVTIPNSVTRIGYGSFYGCTSLTSVTIPDGVTTIDSDAFEGCTSLSSVTISNSVTFIGADSFYNTAWYDDQPDGLIYINDIAYKYKGEMPEGTEIEIADGTTKICPRVFSGCAGLSSITIPNGVTTIGDYAFSGCTGLTSVTIPNSVTTLGDDAFSGCSGLTSVTIGNGVTTLKGETFMGCTGLTSIVAKGENPPLLGYYPEGASHWVSSDMVFESVNKTNCILYVPAGCKSAYKNADGWGEFTNIVEYGEEEPDTDLSAYDNVVYIEGTEVLVGQQIRLSLNMNNTIAPTGFQCDVYLPDGVTAAQDEDGFYLMDISTERTTARKTDYSASVMQPDGGLRFMCSSTNSFTFSGNEGEVAYLMVDIDPDMEEGTYPLILRNIEISDANSNPYRVSYVKTTLTVHTYTLGDANNDGSIGVSDFTAIANYIMGTPPASFVEKAADVNVDGVISVSDLTGEANIILYGTVTPNASHAKARDEATAKYASIGAKDVTATTDKEFTVAVSINGNYAYSGYQFDVALPEGMTVKDVYGQRKATDVFMSGMIDDNTLRVLCASTMGETTESTVVYLTLEAESAGTYSIDIDNAIVSANASSYDLSKTAFRVDIDSSATGISSLSGEADKNVVVYDLQGRRQNDVPGGQVGIVNGNTVYRK